MPFNREAIVERVRLLTGRIAAAEGLEVVETEWKGASKGGTLRVFIDKPTGITHTDCETVSHQLSAVLDVEDLIPSSYRLEVSSPGLDRKLSEPSHFSRFRGHRTRMRVSEPLGGQRHVDGRIEGTGRGCVRLRTDKGDLLEIAYEDIELARLVVEF